jgi:uncharacterized protein (DUF934 family)
MLNAHYDPLVIDHDARPVKEDAERCVLSLASALHEFSETNKSLWVRLEAADDVRELTPFLERVTGFEVNFAGFRDGRGYSTARILRDDLHYTGPIRAVGDVLRDQLFVMMRCGFSEFALKDSDPIAAIKAARTRFSTTYQSASDARATAWALRAKLQS